jgi:hypothetical protein
MEDCQRVISARDLGKFIHETYIQPARQRGDKAVTVEVRQVYDGVLRACTPNLVRGVLGSMKFRNTYGLPLVATKDSPNPVFASFTFKLTARKVHLGTAKR